MITIIRKQLPSQPLSPLWFWFLAGLLYAAHHHACREHYGSLFRHRPCFKRDSSCRPVMNKPRLPDELVLRSRETSSFFCHVYSEAANWGRRGDPFVPRWDTLSNPPMLNKHSQTSDQLTPATGMPSVCRDDGGLLLSIASAVGSEACRGLAAAACYI